MVAIRDVFPPKPSFTEQNLGSQAGKVFDAPGLPANKDNPS